MLFKILRQAPTFGHTNSLKTCLPPHYVGGGIKTVLWNGSVEINKLSCYKS